MIAPFDVLCPTRVTVGVGTALEVERWGEHLGLRVLVVTGTAPARHAELWSRLQLLGKELRFVTIGREPTVEDADAAAQVGRSWQADWVLGVGGGSVIDAAKAAACLMRNPGPALDYLEVVGAGRPVVQASVPLVVMPTTAGTGAEVTRNAVLTSPAHRTKASLRSPYLYPTRAIIDPDMGHGAPRAVQVAAGLDALIQLIEPLTSRRAQPFSDALCREGLRRGGPAFQRGVDQPDDRESRLSMSVAALFSGFALAHAGLGSIHGMAGVLGGHCVGAPHGALCARLLPGIIAANRRRMTDGPEGRAWLEGRYAEAAALILHRSTATANDLEAWGTEIVEQLELPRLRIWGLVEADFATVISQAERASSTKSNPACLTRLDWEHVLRSAW
jgi:alcohol dehydrogenase class IV